jgi:hypothetical protein
MRTECRDHHCETDQETESENRGHAGRSSPGRCGYRDTNNHHEQRENPNRHNQRRRRIPAGFNLDFRSASAVVTRLGGRLVGWRLLFGLTLGRLLVSHGATQSDRKVIRRAC